MSERESTVKTFSCPICNSKNSENSFFNQNLEKCGSCGLHFVTENMRPSEIASLYDREYFQGKVYRDYLNEELFRSNLFKAKIELLDKYFPEQGNVLDIGCATGLFLMLMRERNYKVYGIEISDFAAALAKTKHRINVFHGDMLGTHFGDGFFDLITLWDVLEHLLDPKDTLREIHRVLKNSGLLLIETLNTDSLAAKILKSKWPLHAPPYHLFYFNSRSLKLLLLREGFIVKKVVPVQTYVNTPRGIKTVRYFRSTILRRIIGSLFNDVVIYWHKK
jgi:2-polyprenyl-3-methyl-5-hydroxy-6-metoxy-1,4-benzoquinol methylase